MWSASPAIPIPSATLELASIRIPIPSPSPSPSQCSSEYEATSVVQDDDMILKHGNGICQDGYGYGPGNIMTTSSPMKGYVGTWNKTPQYHTLLSPQPYPRKRVEVPHPISPYDTCPPPPPSPSPSSPLVRPIRPASTSPVRFTFTPHHIMSSQRRSLITASKQQQHIQPTRDIWHGDVSCYPCAPITLKLEKTWMTTSISAPELSNALCTSTTTEPQATTVNDAVSSTPTPIANTNTPTPIANTTTPTPLPRTTTSTPAPNTPAATPTTPTPTPTPHVTTQVSHFLFDMHEMPQTEHVTISIPTPSQRDNQSTPTPHMLCPSSAISPSYATPTISTWLSASSSCSSSSSSSSPSRPAHRSFPSLSIRISISSTPTPTRPLAPRCMSPWITPDQRTPSIVSSH